MYTLILTLHIIVALVTLISTAGVLINARRQVETKLYGSMLGAFAGTALSGIVLLAVSANGLGRFCAMMSAYTVAVVLARRYYRARVLAVSSL